MEPPSNSSSSHRSARTATRKRTRTRQQEEPTMMAARTLLSQPPQLWTSGEAATGRTSLEPLPVTTDRIRPTRTTRRDGYSHKETKRRNRLFLAAGVSSHAMLLLFLLAVSSSLLSNPVQALLLSSSATRRGTRRQGSVRSFPNHGSSSTTGLFQARKSVVTPLESSTWATREFATTCTTTRRPTEPSPLPHQVSQQQQTQQVATIATQQTQPWWMVTFVLWHSILTWHTQHYEANLDVTKCPFLRRRWADAGDALDGFLAQTYQATILPTVVVTSDRVSGRFQPQQQEQQPIWTPIAWRRDVQELQQSQQYHHHPIDATPRSLEQVMELLRADWKAPPPRDVHHDHEVDTTRRQASPPHPVVYHKGYYVTGKLNPTLYAPDCYFDGPDPDLPIQGLRKYSYAARGLFHIPTSHATLTSLTATSPHTCVATWDFQATLRLPWKPQLPYVQGTTTYILDPTTGWIVQHLETWDNVTPLQAFWQTFVVGIENKNKNDPDD